MAIRCSTPLTIHISRNRITSVECENKDLERDFWSYTHTDENSDRVGEFAMGTNIAIHDVIGNILQDEKLPTLHIAFGHPYAEHTGAKWRSTTRSFSTPCRAKSACSPPTCSTRRSSSLCSAEFAASSSSCSTIRAERRDLREAGGRGP